MHFSSIEFIFYFLPISILGYYALNCLSSRLWTKGWLLSCSLFFYGWWNIDLLPLLIGSISVNYLIAIGMIRMNIKNRHDIKKAFLFVGIIGNIFLLGYFKYANFFLENLNSIFHNSYQISNIVLPLGISFFTIQQIAFLMDTYEDIATEKSFLDYSLFVTFFPHLLAGPILHHKQMMPQFHEIKTRFFNAENFSVGLLIFAVGLFKKVVIADPLSSWVAAGYGSSQPSMVDAWVTSISYTFQLYFDFSGYVDMAIGAGLMFNIRLPQNFNSPYQATSIINFWERWHITLSKFITTYIYTPLIRNFPGRITFYKSMIATLLAMFIAGLWHGPAWSYVIFGVFHGVGLVFNHIWRRRKLKLPKAIAWLLTFVFVNTSFVIFRAGDLEQARQIIGAMFGVISTNAPFYSLNIIDAGSIVRLPLIQGVSSAWLSYGMVSSVLALLMGICLFGKSSATIPERFRPTFGYLVVNLFLIFIPLFMMNKVVDFVYFQF